MRGSTWAALCLFAGQVVALTATTGGSLSGIGLAVAITYGALSCALLIAVDRHRVALARLTDAQRVAIEIRDEMLGGLAGGDAE